MRNDRTLYEAIEWFPWYRVDWNYLVAPKLTEAIRLLPHPLYDWAMGRAR